MSDKNSTEYALLAAAQAGTMTASAEPASPYTFGRMIEVDDPTGPSSTTRLDVKRPARPRLTRERVRVLSTAGGRGTSNRIFAPRV